MNHTKAETSIETAALEGFADLVPLGIVTTDAELNIRGWNRWLEERSGLSASRVKGRNLLEVYTDLVERKFDRYYHAALRGHARVLSQRFHRYLLRLPPKAGVIDFEFMQQSAQIAPLVEDNRVVGTITVIEDVTERVHRETMLRDQILELEALEQKNAALYQSMSESESRYRILSDQSLLGVYVIQDGKFRYVNPAFARMFGYGPEELIDTIDPFDMITSTDADKLADAIRSRLSGDNDSNSREFRGVRKDGTICHVESFGTLVTYNDRPAVLGTLLDITERKQADEERRKTEERFQLVAQATNDAVWDWNLETDAVWWNEGVTTLFGYKAEQVGKDVNWWYENIHPEERERVVSGIHEVINSGSQFWTDEYRYRRGDGTYAYIMDRGYVIHDVENRPVRMLGAMADLTERRMAEEIMRTSEERFSKAFNSSPCSMSIVTAREGILIDVNETFLHTTGYLREDLIGRAVVDVGFWADPQEYEKVLRLLKEQGFVQNLESRFLKKSGEMIVELFSAEKIEINGQRCVLTTSVNITEQKRAQEVIRASEERFSKAFNSSPCSMSILTTRDGRYVDINEAFIRSTGYSREETIGRTAENLGIWADEEGRDKVLRLLKEQGFVQNLEVKFSKKSGEETVGLFSAEKIEIGGQQCVLAINVNITEQKHAQEALQRSEEYFRSLIENAHDTTTIVNEQGTIIYTSPSSERVLGYKPEEMVGRNSFEMLHPDDLPVVMELFNSTLGNHGSAEKAEYRYRHKNGSWRVMEAIGNNLFGNPAVRGAVINARDITERKQAEEEVRQSEERYRSLFESNPLPALVHDAETSYFLAVNDAAIEHYGYSREEFLSLKTTQIRPVEEVSKYIALVESQPEKSGNHGEWKHQKKDGTVIDVEIISQPFIFEGRSAKLVIATDITARKQMEEVMMRAKEAAEAANQSKSEFLANMSHEIRTPMNGIIGMTELLIDTPLDSEQREYLEMVRLSADSLLEIINDILDFSKIEAGKLRLDSSEFRLQDTLGDTMKTFAPRAHEKGLELVLHIAPQTPDTLIGDAVRLRQIVVNMLGNAVKFTQSGEIALRIEVEEQSEEEVILHFSIRDTGIGISPEKQQLIFEAFTQADASTTRKFGGTGLGLAISSRLVELMGGSIWVESEAGRGSTFHFTARFSVKGIKVQSNDSLLAGLSALLVDDNQATLCVMAEVLHSCGVSVRLADGAGEALKEVMRAREEGRSYDVAIVDAGMPGIDGLTLISLLKENRQIVRSAILLVSAVKGRPASASESDPYIACQLIKPVKPAELKAAMLRIPGAVGAHRHKTPLGAKRVLPAARRPLRVLLAEDNPVNQHLAVRMLERHGHRVVVANNGRDAVEAFEQQPFDLILMDVQMPEMSGFEATVAIRSRESQTANRIPIIAMTAYAMKGDRERCLEAGMDGYVSKPVRAEELFRAMESVLARSTATEAV